MKKFALFLVCAITLGHVVSAQSVKLGYINSRDLLSMMPEVKSADSSLQNMAKTYQDQIEEMAKEYQKKIQEYQAQEKTMSEVVKEVKIKEIQQLEERIEGIRQSAQEKIEKRREEIYTPIISKAENAIKEIGKANNFDYIFDTSAGSILYHKDADDIMPLVKSKLGIK